ncbi:protein-tyrosine phosphatase-like protein [Pyronema domesticum]|nr:protein-tyrosine phosphatase-like protein [Pyronema domesticum]
MSPTSIISPITPATPVVSVTPVPGVNTPETTISSSAGAVNGAPMLSTPVPAHPTGTSATAAPAPAPAPIEPPHPFPEPTLIAMSTPALGASSLYRNPLPDVVHFLQSTHRDSWHIFEFRAEGCGYKDSDVMNRVSHYPWPDHHAPPFVHLPAVVAEMREHLTGAPASPAQRKVAVVHCKAGKGRSGTVSCAYLMAEHGWSKEAAMARFTERRMRRGFGEGVSIPSQRRYLDYVEKWIAAGKVYTPRAVRVSHIQIYGLRQGVRVSVQGYIEGGRKIHDYHRFKKSERQVMKRDEEGGKCDVVLTPDTVDGGIVVPGGDINLDFVKKTKVYGMGLVTSVSHVWWNAWWEGGGAENGTYEVQWEELDGVKGTRQKGRRGWDRCLVVWSLEPEQDAAAGEAEGEQVNGQGGELNGDPSAGHQGLGQNLANRLQKPLETGEGESIIGSSLGAPTPDTSPRESRDGPPPPPVGDTAKNQGERFIAQRP